MAEPLISRVRRGRAPSCSATGSVVGIAIGGAIAAAAVVNTFAERFATWRDTTGGGSNGDGSPEPDPRHDIRIRDEANGSILAWPDPPALLYVDATTAGAAKARGARVIGGQPAPRGALSAPTEVHIAATERCVVACDGCYLGAGPASGADADPNLLDADLVALADQGVFEIAIGGGEVASTERIVALCARIHELGMVPNLTTSGFGLDLNRARALAAWVGQVNVSVDGLDHDYRAVRGWDGRRVALRAIAALRAAGVRVGVNTVLTSENLDALEVMGRELRTLGVDEWQWVRFKPVGRGKQAWDRLAPSPEALAALWPRLVAIEAATGLVMRVDCALVPFVAAHAPSPEIASRLGLTGCNGGESLWARTADGRFAPCSYAHELVGDEARGDPAARWMDEPQALAWREAAAAPHGPCGTCEWQAVCRGGCRLVAAHLSGDATAPDPECPRVIAWEQNRASSP